MSNIVTFGAEVVEVEAAAAAVRFLLSDNATSDMSITLSERQTRRPPRRSMDTFFLEGDSLSMSGNNVWLMELDDESAISNATSLSSLMRAIAAFLNHS